MRGIMTEWQAVDSVCWVDAEGEPILRLLFAPHEMGGYIFVGTFFNRKWIDNLGRADDHKPTHCQPLPEYPTD